MVKGIAKALRLEINSMKERWLSLLFYLFAPAIIVGINYYSSKTLIDWGAYASLNLRLYDFFAPRLLPLIILFVSLQLTILRIVGERSPAGTLDRDLMAITRSEMYLGKWIANTLFVILQVIFIYVAGYIIFPARNYALDIYILIYLFLIAVFGSVTGLTISVFSKTREQAIQSVPIIMLILLLFSGNVVQLEQMPSKIYAFAINSPLPLASESLKMLTLDGVGFEDVQINAFKLLIWISVITLLGILKFKYERR